MNNAPMSNAPDPLMSAPESEPLRVASGPAQSKADFKLSDYQWQHRLVLIFAPTKRSSTYQQQKQLWQAHLAGMQERDLKLVEVLAAGESRVDGHPMTIAAAERLRKQFGIDSEAFAVLLIGKDGTEKQRDKVPVEPEVLFRTIDAMPMRQQEQRQKEQRDRR
ncbi:MAG: DUF4174 domain-containing protein [Leptolyngbya sp. BL-A-14]